jgi:hypothetical protein
VSLFCDDFFRLSLKRLSFPTDSSLMPSMELLDDVVVDVPLAYAFAAEIITAGKLSADDVEELGDAIEVLGEVSPLPKDKLKTQVEKLQG